MLLWLCSNLCWLNVLNTRQNLNDTAKLAQSFELNSYDSFILKFHSTSIRLKHSHGYCIHFNEKILHSDGNRKTTNRSEYFENPSFTAVRLFFRSLCSVCIGFALTTVMNLFPWYARFKPKIFVGWLCWFLSFSPQKSQRSNATS